MFIFLTFQKINQENQVFDIAELKLPAWLIFPPLASDFDI